MELYRLTTMLAAIGCLIVAAMGLAAAIVPRVGPRQQPRARDPGALARRARGRVDGQAGAHPATTSFCGVAAASICLLLMAPELFAAALQQRVAPRGQTIKVVQHNLWSENVDPAATARWLISQDADVLVLEEVVGNTSRYPSNRLQGAPTPIAPAVTAPSSARP